MRLRGGAPSRVIAVPNRAVLLGPDPLRALNKEIWGRCGKLELFASLLVVIRLLFGQGFGRKAFFRRLLGLLLAFRVFGGLSLSYLFRCPYLNYR